MRQRKYQLEPAVALERQEHVCDSHGHAPAVLNYCYNVVQDGPQERIKRGAAFQIHAGAHALDACKAASLASAEAHMLAKSMAHARCIHMVVTGTQLCGIQKLFDNVLAAAPPPRRARRLMLPSLMALPRASNNSVRLRPFLAPRWPCPFRGAVSESPCVRLTIPSYLCAWLGVPSNCAAKIICAPCTANGKA